MSVLLTLARQTRPFIEKAAQSLSDADGLKAKTLYPRWEKLVQMGSVTAEAGYRFTHIGDLYKCVNANPTFQSNWIPGIGTEALYTRIDEEHDGSLYDPIPYEGNMALVSGKYYSQDGVVYLCSRDTVNPVYNALADLIGIYVEVET